MVMTVMVMVMVYPNQVDTTWTHPRIEPDQTPANVGSQVRFEVIGDGDGDGDGFRIFDGVLVVRLLHREAQRNG